MRATLHAEWGKTWSVRAPALCLALSALAVLVTASSLANDFLVGVTRGEHLPTATLPLDAAVGPALQLGQLVVAAFALQLVAAEYSTGAVRATFQAQPRRWVVLLSKAVVAGGCAAVLGAVLGAGCGAVVRQILGDHADEVLGLPALAVRSAAVLALVAVFAVGLAAAVRSAVGTLSAVTVLLTGTLVLPDRVGRWTPGPAGAALLDATRTGRRATEAVLVLVAWALVALLAGSWLLERRDA